MKKNSLVNDLSCADIYSMFQYCENMEALYHNMVQRYGSLHKSCEDLKKSIEMYIDNREYYGCMKNEFEDILKLRIMTYHNELIKEEE